MMSVSERVKGFAEDLLGAGIYLAEQVVVGAQEQEDREVRSAALTAVPIVIVGIALTATGMTMVGLGRACARSVHDGVELVVEGVNIYRELCAAGEQFERYEGPSSPTLRTVMGIVASPMAMAARLTLNRR